MTNFTSNTYTLKRKILTFTNKFSKRLSKPESKFVADITYGLLASGSCLLTDVADQLHETTKKINTVDRLSQHLEKGTPIKAATSYLQTIKKWVPDEPVIHIDDSDVVKPEGYKFEALGILNFLWFWGMKNADETGLVKDADLEVLSRYLYGCGEDCQLDMGKVVQALVDTGWIDVAADGFYIHDWDTWQEQWYKLQKNRRLDAERKRKARQMEREAAKPAPKTPEPEQMELPVEPEAKRPVKPKPDKKSYAEFVKMSEANYDRLVKLYGKAFADACIVELDNYKGARGKTYKDDYRAILCWVVDRVKEKKPGLLQQSVSETAPAEDNPFREWGEQNG